MVLIAHDSLESAQESAKFLTSLGSHALRLMAECVESTGVKRKQLSAAAKALETAGFLFVRDTSMRTLFTIHPTNEVKLASVIGEMKLLGAPTIRVVDCRDYYMAIEGTHRIAAAAVLSISPILDVLDQDDLVDADSLDLENLCSGVKYTAGEIAGEVYSPSCGIYAIDGDGTVRAI